MFNQLKQDQGSRETNVREGAEGYFFSKEDTRYILIDQQGTGEVYRQRILRVQTDEKETDYLIADDNILKQDKEGIERNASGKITAYTPENKELNNKEISELAKTLKQAFESRT